MCHAAIVAREYGLPAVIGTGTGDEADQDRRPASGRRRRGRRDDPRLTAHQSPARHNPREDGCCGRHRARGRARRDPGVPGRGRAGPGGARALRRGRDRQDDPLGDGRRGGPGAFRPGARPAAGSRRRRRSRSPGSPTCSATVLEEAGRRWRRRAGGRSRSRCCSSSRARRPPDPHAIGLAVLDVLRALAAAGPVLVALDDVQWLDPASAGVAPDRAPAPARRARRRARDAAARPRSSRSPFELERVVPGGTARADLGRSAEPRRAPRAARGAARARADAAGARPRAGGDGGQSVLRARARARARPHGHEARRPDGRCRCRRACASCSAAVSPACPGRRWTCCSRSRRSPGRRSSWSRRRTATAERVVEALEAAVAGGCRRARRTPRFASRTRCSPRSATSRRRSGSAAPSTGRSPAVVSDVEERARHLALAAEGPDEAVAAELDARRRARGRPRSAPLRRPQLFELAVGLTPDDAGRLGAAAAGGRLSSPRRGEPAGGGDPRAAARGGSAGRRARRRALRAGIDVHGRQLADDRALRRGAGRGRRRRRPLRADPGVQEPVPAARGRRSRGSLRRPGGARERRARRRSCTARGLDRAGRARRDVHGRDHAGAARAGRRDRAAPRPQTRASEQPAVPLRANGPAAGEARRGARHHRAGRGRRGGARRRDQPDRHRLVPGHSRVVRRPPAERPRPCVQRRRVRRGSRVRTRPRLGGARPGARRDGPRPGR